MDTLFNMSQLLM